MNQITSPQIQQNTRTAEPTFPVWSPDGIMFMYTRQNINDLVRHNGWYQQDPVHMIATAKRMQERAEAIVAGRAAVAEGQPQTGRTGIVGDVPALPRLDALRKELGELGGVPDPTWGVAFLEQVIAAKKQGRPMPKTADEIADAAADAAAVASEAEAASKQATKTTQRR